MKTAFNRLLFCFVIAGALGTYVSLKTGLDDNRQLEHAVRVGNPYVELNHRLNVAAEGNWILLSLLVMSTALAGMRPE